EDTVRCHNVGLVYWDAPTRETKLTIRAPDLPILNRTRSSERRRSAACSSEIPASTAMDFNERHSPYGGSATVQASGQSHGLPQATKEQGGLAALREQTRSARVQSRRISLRCLA